MTYSPNPLALLTRHHHRADPELIRALFQPMIDAVEYLRPLMQYYEDHGIRFPSPLEKECQRATRAYFDTHASDFRPTWPFVATRSGQAGRR